MNTENITICPICNNTSFEFFLETHDFTVTHETFQLIKCNNCNFLITSPRPTIDSIGKYYASEKYISHSGGTKSLFDRIYLLARNLTLQWKYNLIKKYSTESGAVLDYGCGTGDFLNFLSKREINIFGVEPNNTAREKANIKLEGKVLENIQDLKSNSINIITLWHVLEHVHDLNNTIQQLKNLLSTSGHLIIAVPNPKSHDSMKYNHVWAGYDVPRHLWHFTQKTLTQLLLKNGLKLVETTPMKLDSYYVSLLSETYKNPQNSKFTIAIKALLEGFISNLSAKRTSQYSSLIYIFKTE